MLQILFESVQISQLILILIPHRKVVAILVKIVRLLFNAHMQTIIRLCGTFNHKGGRFTKEGTE